MVDRKLTGPCSLRPLTCSVRCLQLQSKAAIKCLLWGPVLSSICALLIVLVLFPEWHYSGPALRPHSGLHYCGEGHYKFKVSFVFIVFNHAYSCIAHRSHSLSLMVTVSPYCPWSLNCSFKGDYHPFLKSSQTAFFKQVSTAGNYCLKIKKGKLFPLVLCPQLNTVQSNTCGLSSVEWEGQFLLVTAALILFWWRSLNMYLAWSPEVTLPLALIISPPKCSSKEKLYYVEMFI